MSGIYGICRFDGAPVDPEWMERMRSAMAYYGPDGGGSRIEGPVGMGHLLLATNPEDVYENQPMATARGMIVCAARLDNRADLFDAFHISSQQAPLVSDGKLVSLAWERWGEQVAPHLHGDWALAGWDARERKLVLLGDACGCSALYYYPAKGYIAFASNLKALLALPGVVKEPDLLRIAEVLAVWQHDAELTAYKGFKRIVRAHGMSVDDNGKMRSWRHWSPEGRELLRYRRDEEYVEEFLDHYNRAVQSCLRTQKPVAALLSGGRDSGSVVSLAAEMLARQNRTLTAYTSVPAFSTEGVEKNWFGNEWERAHAIATMAGPNVRHVPEDAAGYGLIQGIEHFLAIHDGPIHSAGNLFWIQAITESAARSGAGVLLTGQKGNASVSWSGNGGALLALLQGDPNLARQLLLYAEPNLWLTIKRQILKPVLSPVQRLLKRLKNPIRSPWREYSALNPQLAVELDLDCRMRRARHDSSLYISPLEDKRLRFFVPGTGSGVSMHSEAGARHSLLICDPTCNQSLVEFLFRVPDIQFRRNGQSSYLFLRAFQKRIPYDVLTGQSRGMQAADIGPRVLRELPAFSACLESFANVPLIRQTLDLPSMCHCLHMLNNKVDVKTASRARTILLRGVAAGLFLRSL